MHSPPILRTEKIRLGSSIQALFWAKFPARYQFPLPSLLIPQKDKTTQKSIAKYLQTFESKQTEPLLLLERVAATKGNFSLQQKNEIRKNIK